MDAHSGEDVKEAKKGSLCWGRARKFWAHSRETEGGRRKPSWERRRRRSGLQGADPVSSISSVSSGEEDRWTRKLSMGSLMRLLTSYASQSFHVGNGEPCKEDHSLSTAKAFNDIMKKLGKRKRVVMKCHRPLFEDNIGLQINAFQGRRNWEERRR